MEPEGWIEEHGGTTRMNDFQFAFFDRTKGVPVHK